MSRNIHAKHIHTRPGREEGSKRYLYGANFAASSSISFSGRYLNLPPPAPLALSLLMSRPMNAAQPLLGFVSLSSILGWFVNSNEYLLYTQIPRGKDINPLQSKASKHLNRPQSQAPDRGQLIHKLLVTGIQQHPSTQFPARELLR